MKRRHRTIRHRLERQGILLTVLASLLAPVAAPGQSDYERALQVLPATAERETRSFAAEAPASGDLRQADLLFRRATLTECLPDLRAAKAAFDRVDDTAATPGLVLARGRLALHFHSLPEARQALIASEGSVSEPLRAQLAFDFALQGGRYAEAREVAATWERENASPDELCRAAALAGFDGQTERADRLFARAEEQLTAKEMRFFAWVALERGALQFRAGRFPAAAEHYRRAEKAWSGWWRVAQRQAELLAAEGHFAESEDRYRKLCANQDRPELEQELGDLLIFQKKEAQAAECYQRALAVYLDSAGRGEVIYLHHLTALYAEGLRNPSEALRWAHADVAARGNASARDALAWALYLAGDDHAAVEATRAALATGSQEAHVLYHAGMILMSAGEIGEARKLLQKPTVALLVGSRTFHAHR